jgi:uncharacterized protein YpiB (UPF0302 family)
MNKTDLIQHLADKHTLTKAEAGRILDTLLDVVVASVKKGDAVVIRVAAQEHHPLRHQILLKDIRYLEAKNACIEFHGTLQITDHQNHMANFPDFKRRHPIADRRTNLINIEVHYFFLSII